MLNKLLLSAVLLVGLLNVTPAVSQRADGGMIAFYNLENLFDTIDTPNVRDTEFTPAGKKAWNSERYWKKVSSVAAVIKRMATREGVKGPAVLGLCEVENKQVVVDLVNDPQLKALNYQIVHYDSPDKRGIDVCLVYQPDCFEVSNSRAVPLMIYDAQDGDRIHTRDQLVVSGLFAGEPMHFIVNHWPSRWGGEERSRPLRIEAAKVSRSIIDSILVTDAKAKVMLMGDLNDDPINESVTEHLHAKENKRQVKKGDLFNPLQEYFSKGEGSLAYKGKWNLFDQIIFTKSVLKKGKGNYKYKHSGIYDEQDIRVAEGPYKGYPFRTYVGSNYHGGYSDHFPVYIMLVR
ncbi:MAG: endonuclease/exonuclease/phosphatase family protein [Marinilabiliaceae bacterium]|nr:endonuclease/exonuclease/phosphatase family protein [Marinilabiliaceae bacterium]